MAKIYLLTTDEVKKIPEQYCLKHFPARYERSLKYRFEADRLRCIGIGVLLYGICGFREEDLITGEFGKLQARDGNVHFSVSHSGEYCVLAVSDHPVGVDVELEKDSHLKVAGRVYQESEIRWMEERIEERVGRFFKLWSLKESVMKATGMGFSLSPQSFNVLPLLEGESIEVMNRNWYGENLSLPGYGLSVCTGEKEGNHIIPINAKNLKT